MPGALTALLIEAVVWTTGNAKRARAYFDMEPHSMDVVTMGEIAASLSTRWQLGRGASVPLSIEPDRPQSHCARKMMALNSAINATANSNIERLRR